MRAPEAMQCSMTIYGALDRDNHPQRILFFLSSEHSTPVRPVSALATQFPPRFREQCSHSRDLSDDANDSIKKAAKMRDLLISKLSRKSAPNLLNQFVKIS